MLGGKTLPHHRFSGMTMSFLILLCDVRNFDKINNVRWCMLYEQPKGACYTSSRATGGRSPTAKAGKSFEDTSHAQWRKSSNCGVDVMSEGEE